MANQRGLGRGFDALLPTELDVAQAVKTPSGDAILQLSASRIVPNPHQPRKNFDMAQLQGLADSIRHHGILQPLVVTHLEGDKYELIAGERRLRAAKIAKIDKVPAIVRSFDEQQKLELALIENIQRAELNALETALAYRRLADEFGLTLADISQRVGQAVSTVSNIMRLLNLPVVVQKMLIEGQLSEAHSRQVLAIKGEAAQIEAAKLIVEKKWTTKQAEEFVRAHKKDSSGEVAKVASAVSNVNESTKAISAFLNTKVSLHRTAKGGRLIIEYRDDEDLERIAKAIND